MKLRNFGYKETLPTPARRKSLKKAIRRHNADRIIKALRSRKTRKTGYKVKRLRADINYLKKVKKSFGINFF